MADAKNWYDSSNNNNLNTQRASGMPDIGVTGGNLAVTSTNIEVFANGMRVGFVQSLTPSETRNIVKVQELGTEGVVQSVPSNTQGGQLTISRFAVYNANLYNALGATKQGTMVNSKSTPAMIYDNATTKPDSYKTYGNPFKTLKDQRVPLEFKVKTKMPDSNNYLMEDYVDCWLASYSKTLAANTITITENATIQYSDVYANYTNV